MTNNIKVSKNSFIQYLTIISNTQLFETNAVRQNLNEIIKRMDLERKENKKDITIKQIKECLHHYTLTNKYIIIKLLQVEFRDNNNILTIK